MAKQTIDIPLSNSSKTYSAVDSFTFEGMRKVLGGNGTGTPDGLAPYVIFTANFLFEDINTLVNPNASIGEISLAAGNTFIKPVKIVDKASDIAGNAKKAKNAAQAKDNSENLTEGTVNSNENIVYRALNQKDSDRLSQGLGLEAKNPNGTWKLDEHIVGGSGKASWVYDPFISTTIDIDIARGFNQSGSNLGIVKIDLNKVPSQALKGYEIYPRLNGVEGLPYHYSIWQQEISIHQSIPIEAIKGFVK